MIDSLIKRLGLIRTNLILYPLNFKDKMSASDLGISKNDYPETISYRSDANLADIIFVLAVNFLLYIINYCLLYDCKILS